MFQATRISYNLSKNGDSISVSIAFGMTALGRRYLPTGSIVKLAKTQVYASIKQLMRQGGLAPEAMDGPLCGGTQLFVQTQQTVVGAHNVQCNGQLL